MKPSGIGGQAVLEGIMMKNKEKYAVAVRKADGEIALEVNQYQSITKNHKLLRLPFIRGVFNFIDAMILGMKTLNYSSSFLLEEEESEEKKDKSKALLMGVVTVISFAIAILLFMVFPLFVVQGLQRIHPFSSTVQAVLEGILRIALFVGYILCISLMKDIRRTFMYHGAEHKCISCIENGWDLTVENVKKSSKVHKRCGTSFLFFVMFISILCFMIIRVETLGLRILTRLLFIPIIAGISFEIIMLAGKSDNFFINLLSKPGLYLQALTTKEPDGGMIEVAIEAVEAVFDWSAYQEKSEPNH